MFKSNKDYKLYLKDILTHHYFGVDDKILWDTLDEDFDKFEKVIKDILNNLDK